MPSTTHAASTAHDRRTRSAPPPPARAQVLIVDDHPLVAHGLAQMLAETSDLGVAGVAGDAGAALSMLGTTPVDAMVVDISLKGTSGIDLIKSVRQRHGAAIRALVVSMHDESLYAERALRAGASGYVVKDQPADTILSALRAVVRGGIWVSEAVSSRIQGGAGARRMAPTVDSPLGTLTDRELEVFQLIGQGRSTREISKTLHISVKTVESHRLHIKDKLALRTGTELIRHAVQWVHEAASARG